MKRIITILMLLLATCMLHAQNRDSLLMRINEIKMAPNRYLYGICTVQGANAPQASRDEALAQLRYAVDGFLTAEGLSFLAEDRTPWLNEAVQYVSCDVLDDCTRTLAFVAKKRLHEKNDALADEYGSRTRQAAADSLIQSLRKAKTLDAVFALVEGASLREDVTMGQTIDDQSQTLADNGFLVYFEPSSRLVLEVMTPMDASFARKNLSTGEPANPLQYRTTPIWIHIDGLKMYHLL